VAERRERAVYRIRIVTTTGFRADTYNQGPTVSREFISKTWVVHLRHGPKRSMYVLPFGVRYPGNVARSATAIATFSCQTASWRDVPDVHGLAPHKQDPHKTQ
jgi:hypothetical protein